MTIISLFLYRVWRYVCPLVSCRSNLVLDYLFGLFFFHFLLVCEYLHYSHVYTWFSLELPCMYVGLLLTIAYALVLSFIWEIECCWVSLDDWWVFLGTVRIYIQPFILPETPFDLLLIRFCSCHSFLLFVFGISELDLFSLRALFAAICEWLQGLRVAESIIAFYISFISKNTKIFCFFILLHPCIFAFAWYLH